MSWVADVMVTEYEVTNTTKENRDEMTATSGNDIYNKVVTFYLDVSCSYTVSPPRRANTRCSTDPPVTL